MLEVTGEVTVLVLPPSVALARCSAAGEDPVTSCLTFTLALGRLYALPYGKKLNGLGFLATIVSESKIIKSLKI